MYGRVTRCFPDKGYAFILGEDNNSYFVHYSYLNGEHIERGYYVFFVPFQNERSNFNAAKVTVINAPEKSIEEKTATPKKKNHKKHKPCNADKVIFDNGKFQRFIRNFMIEQSALNVERSDNGKIY